MADEIKLLQFLICRDFTEQIPEAGQPEHEGRDTYQANGVLSNYFVTEFPSPLNQLHAVTCWRKDQRFHKEVIEYQTEEGLIVKTPPMDIEPVTSNVHFRWHKHRFPSDLVIEKASLLTVRVVLDWKTLWETYILIEKN